MRLRYLLMLVVFFAACKPGRKVNTSFYYWKTVYRQNTTENTYIKQLHVNKLYVRIMDVDMDEDGATPVPVSPITFQDKLPDTLQMVPVVFVVNDILRNLTHDKLNDLSRKLYQFVSA